MRKRLEKYKEVIAFIFSIISVLIIVVTTEGSKKFLIVGLVLLGILVVTYFLLKFSRAILGIFSIVIIVASLIFYAIFNRKENQPVIEKVLIRPSNQSDSSPTSGTGEGGTNSTHTQEHSVTDTSNLISKDTSSIPKKITIDSGNGPGISLQELSVNKKEGMYQVKGADPTFAKDRDANNYMKVRFGFSNPTKNTFYITGVKIGLLKFERLSNYDSKKDKVIDIIAVTFKTAPSNETIDKIKNKYGLETQNKFSELFIFRAVKPLDSASLMQLKAEKDILQVRESSVGTAHGEITFTTYSAKEAITPTSRNIFIDTDEKLSANDLAGIEIKLEFSSSGKYKLKSQISYGKNKTLSTSFTVIVP